MSLAKSTHSCIRYLTVVRNVASLFFASNLFTMTFKNLILFCLFTFLHFHLAATKIDVTTFTESNIIERDVCIIGGGASGTYAAVRLLQSGKSVALIEKK